MPGLLEAMRSGTVLADGAIGSLLFERTGRLSESNHVYEAMNADRPELIRSVHMAYLQAGARCITTNTFGANASYMEPVGEGARVGELNRAGVEVAREAIASFQQQTGAAGPFFVVGSIGPTRTGQEPAADLRAVYLPQLEALVQASVDGLLFETFAVLDHLTALVRLAKEVSPQTPVLAEMALRLHPDGSGWLQDPAEFVAAAVEAGADTVGVNCCAPWEATAFMDAVRDLPVVSGRKVLVTAMPNAGGFQRIGHRYMTHVNPEYMGKLVRTLAGKGVSLAGGCCEVHPSYIAEMYNYLHGLEAGATAPAAVSERAREPVGDEVKKSNGGFSRKIKSGEFAVSVEMLPPRGTSPQLLKSRVEFVEELAASGLADSLDVTDGSRGIPLIPPGDFAGYVRDALGWNHETGDRLEFIPHFSTRDLNVIGLQSRLMGYHVRRIHNVLFVTGDPPKMAPGYPRSTAVFDLDSIAMIRYAHSYMNAGVDFGGEPLGRQPDPRTRFTIGCGFEPEAVNRERELERLRRKLDAGADYVFTQPVFSPGPLDRLALFRSGPGRTVPILIGVMVLSSLEHANRMAQLPGVVVPDSLLKRMAAYEKADDQARLGQDVAIEQIQRVREQGWAGLYLMSPASHRPVIPILRAALEQPPSPATPQQ